MNGYAVCSGATALASPGRPLLLRVCGTVAASDELTELDERILRNEVEPCLEIMTGGIFPKVVGTTRRLDACVRVEDTATVFVAGTTGRVIMITKPVAPDENRRPAGRDIRLGERIFKRGDVLGSSHIMPLARSGYQRSGSSKGRVSQCGRQGKNWWWERPAVFRMSTDPSWWLRSARPARTPRSSGCCTTVKKPSGRRYGTQSTGVSLKRSSRQVASPSGGLTLWLPRSAILGRRLTSTA